MAPAGKAWPGVAKALGVTAVLRVDDKGEIEMTQALAARLKFVPGARERTVIRIVAD